MSSRERIEPATYLNALRVPLDKQMIQVPQFLSKIRRNYPAYVTRDNVDERVLHRASLIGALGACLLPCLGGMVLAALSWLLSAGSNGNTTSASETLIFVLEGLALILIASIGLSTCAAVPAYFICTFAIRAGKAGWLAAIAAGSLVSVSTFYIAVWLGFSMQGHPVVVGIVTGSLYGGLFWLIARLSTPLAFVETTSDDIRR